MTIQIELNTEMESQLIAAPEALGIGIELYARGLLLEAIAARHASRSRASQEEFRESLDAMASKSPDAPDLRTETFSRAMIYDGHD